MKRIKSTVLCIAGVAIMAAPVAYGDGLIANHTLTGHWQEIPTEIINQVVDNSRIYYVHTSHGSQLITGLSQVHDIDNRFPDLNYYPYQIVDQVGNDLGYEGDTSWAAPTRTYLDAYPECTIVMFSWCGGVSYNTEAGIDIYLNKMNSLEAQYPNVAFVYMTGHLDGDGPSGNLYQRNNQIRQYCIANSKVLYDFADIESYDPDGTYYPDVNDACEWATDWCDDPGNGCDNGCDCAHSHCFNCRLKAQTFWCLLAYLEGWRPTAIDLQTQNMPDSYTLSQNHPNPFNAETTISYHLLQAGEVRLEVFDIRGTFLERLVDNFQLAGDYQITFGGKDMASGVYLYKIKAGSFEKSHKMILIK